MNYTSNNTLLVLSVALAASSVAKYLQTEFKEQNWGSDIGKAARKLQKLQQVAGGETLPAYEFGSGRFGTMVKEELQLFPTEQQVQWHQLFHHLSGASSSKPGKKFIKSVTLLIDAIGARDFKNQANKWLLATVNLDISKQPHTYIHDGHTDTFHTIEYIESNSFNLIKGLLWSMSRFHDKQSLQIIARLTEKCFQKIPGVGPAAAGVGNAGIYTLAQSKGMTGISHLSRLKLRIRQNNTQKLIQKFINEQAKKKGIKPAQIEEIAAVDFGLCNGELIEVFDDYKLRLRLTGIGSLEQQWLKPNGELQKSVPVFIKDKIKLSVKLKKIRELVKQIKQASTAQRDRIDRLYTDNMSWTLIDFEKYYLHHGLVSHIARKLIWNLDQQPALFFEGQWQNELGEEVSVREACTIRLWHPMDSEIQTVLAWRERLEMLHIKQPLKQAYREIYLLTDAEIKTRTYSNRMAAHILKQHQFNSLAALRGWKYSLLGSYDDGRYVEIATKDLSEYGVTAQYCINEMNDDSDFNETGIWHYVATDQVLFIDRQDQPVPLVDIPPLIFSETMRDVDLFVGVASVGNDPHWQDGGLDSRQSYRDYWRSYSFGELGEMAKTRKLVLERLLPRLKIRDVARIEGRFLIVDGKIHTYKIHIGSSNILIAPNDRYLCIVPGPSKDKNLEQIFLPFEGDNGLSIVLSKAFMLVDDDKIKDKTIISQL